MAKGEYENSRSNGHAIKEEQLDKVVKNKFPEQKFAISVASGHEGRFSKENLNIEKNGPEAGCLSPVYWKL